MRSAFVFASTSPPPLTLSIIERDAGTKALIHKLVGWPLVAARGDFNLSVDNVTTPRGGVLVGKPYPIGIVLSEDYASRPALITNYGQRRSAAMVCLQLGSDRRRGNPSMCRAFQRSVKGSPSSTWVFCAWETKRGGLTPPFLCRLMLRLVG
jgi:hypothetical protein